MIRRSLTLALLSVACAGPGASRADDARPDVRELFEVERRFARMVVEEGRTKAFLHYSASDSVNLRPDSPAMVGRAALAEQLAAESDEDFSLSWKPEGGSIGACGDLGYTWGVWTIRIPGAPEELHGNYVTIWRRGSDGEWRFVLDGGTQFKE